MIKTEQQVTLTIDVNPEDAWKIIGSVKNVDKWFPEMIKTCELKGNTRICGTEQGDIIEEVLKIDNENKEFKYAFIKQNMVPDIDDLIGSMKVLTDEKGKTVVNWKWTFHAKDIESANQAKEAFKGAGNMGIKGIESYAKELNK
ncbi:polyketide cyclase/dehydrase/lipid transport protein [Gillisia sp. Hel_I_86]|uniref:SRPBCC family protein n=1 Tax=Gillisia sp. Hel_I_86 TaxID=1249981 RepID=UPI0011990192|nr:SRPBCC family protein [Gillisia sp. Hel_I_86]TVZ27896.1 polyketide cyclase/dehydrase/lipid transport protein [Gillisia sp. Hel_I_86]